MSEKKILLVVGAVFHRVEHGQQQVLLFKRRLEKDHGGTWEIPGGKIEAGESPEAALVREIQEELNVKIKAGAFLAESDSEQPARIIRLMAYAAELVSGEFELSDHDQMQWVNIKDMRQLPLAPADMGLVKALHRIYGVD
jgi:8-oxo-dGTP diphosphatase